ncbi:MAG: RNA polymerase sigma factor [Planctomycetota bacterium]|jgi:RNA polymerase sigma-70 factor (ECF subfamily)
MTKKTDDLLMRLAAAGDTASFHQLAKRYREAGLRYCMRILGDYQQAEDVIQEGLVNLYNALPRYVEKGRFKTFFFKILSNLCIDNIRRRRRIQPNQERGCEVSLGGLEEGFADPSLEDPVQSLLRREKAQAVRRLISRLPKNQRRAIELRELRGFKYQEISHAMGCRMNRVKVLIFRGRRNLARLAMEQRLTA